MVTGMDLKKLYLNIYEQFIRTRDTHKGFHFQEETLKSVAPKTVSFKNRVQWWTLDRPSRLKKIEQERDRQQQEILTLKQKLVPDACPRSPFEPGPGSDRGSNRGPSG